MKVQKTDKTVKICISQENCVTLQCQTTTKNLLTIKKNEENMEDLNRVLDFKLNNL